MRCAPPGGQKNQATAPKMAAQSNAQLPTIKVTFIAGCDLPEFFLSMSYASPRGTSNRMLSMRSEEVFVLIEALSQTAIGSALKEDVVNEPAGARALYSKSNPRTKGFDKKVASAFQFR